MSDNHWREIAHAWRDLLIDGREDSGALARSMILSAMALLHADDGFVSIIRQFSDAEPDDPLWGWRVVRMFHVDPRPLRQRLWKEMERSEAYVPDLHSQAVVRGAGSMRALLRHDALTPEEWAETPSRQYLETIGVTDQIVAGVPLDTDVELILGVSSKGPMRFDESHRERLLDLCGGLRVPGLRIAHASGISEAPLTKRERDVLRHMLRGLSEKEAAVELDLSSRTVHHHVTSVYRKVGVNSRAELMALWLGPAGR